MKKKLYMKKPVYKNGLKVPYKKPMDFWWIISANHRGDGFDTAEKAKKDGLRALQNYKCGEMTVLARFSDWESEELGTWTAKPTACVIKRVKPGTR